jgi:hypothetical protein
MADTQAPSKDIVAVDDAYMAKNRSLGIVGISQDDLLTPILKVVQPTSKDRDVNGAPFKPGLLLYKATGATFETLDIGMLAVTKGTSQSYDKTTEQSKFIFLGVTVPEMMPFKMYAQGSQYYEARKFLTQIRMTKKPMYTQNVHVVVEKMSNEKGEWYVAKLNITGTFENDKILAMEKMVKTYMATIEKEATSEDVDPSDIPF